MEARSWGDARKGSLTKECMWPLEAEKGKERNRFSLEASSRNVALVTS